MNTRMSRWLARLSFSFIILAAVFAWEGYKIRARAADSSNDFYYFLAAGACAVVGMMGIRQRHK